MNSSPVPTLRDNPVHIQSPAKMPRTLLPTFALAIVLLSTLLTPFRRELFVGDETKYSEVVREMRATGAFLLPTLNGTPFTHKPPIHFWLLDLLTIPFGVYSLWPFVIPSLLAFAALLWLMHRMGGAVAAFVCGTSILVWGSAQTARMDVEFTLFITLGAWMLQRFFDDDDFRALLIAAVSLAVATLIKGPMAPVIAIMLFLFEWWRRKRVPRGNYLPAVAALVVIPLLWVVPAMIRGGSTYRHDIVVKQTVGRAFGAWVHQSPPWYYLAHSPAFLFPWFLLLVVALLRRGHDGFHRNWLLAVLVPYSLMSSKLDVYMMALVPPAALLIAQLVRSDDARDVRRGRIANMVMLLLFALVGVAGLLIQPRQLKEGGELLARGDVRLMFGVLLAAAVIAVVVALRDRALTGSTYAVGLVPLAMLIYVAAALMPLVNDLASSRPLVVALTKQQVAPEQVALYACPHLWSRDMSPALERVHYVDAKTLLNAAYQPELIATSRKHAVEIAPALARYRKVDQLQLIGKWFDVYRR